MRSSYLSWPAAVDLFERRGLPQETYRNLYEEEYILCPGSAAINGEFSLNDHDRSPWSDDTPDGATGYIVDGDLTVDGNIVNDDDGAASRTDRPCTDEAITSDSIAWADQPSHRRTAPTSPYGIPPLRRR
ncbi:hypothetical protein [Sphaerisporangium fuscum]|uniref:hypothetical protein n=1 Tax=Sphaerisporangium fuscum TaxID=2835868 RepID=UPI001BDD7EC4|nr:hypothetical protein [Sphaerisporangium fuscum]